MTTDFIRRIEQTLADIENDGLTKVEREILSSQSAEITVRHNGETTDVLNFCANNYLGLANHPDLIRAAADTAEKYGYGMASVRFICGTQDIHRLLEREIAAFLGYDDSILFAACFDANGGVFEPLLGPVGDVDLQGVAWAIVGGESGPRARPMDESWARQIRDICERDDVAFFFKQWGGARPKSGGRLLDGEEWNGFPWQIVPKPILDQISA